MALWKRRRIATVCADRVRIAVAYLTISSYWPAIRSHRIGLPTIVGARRG